MGLPLRWRCRFSQIPFGTAFLKPWKHSKAVSILHQKNQLKNEMLTYHLFGMQRLSTNRRCLDLLNINVFLKDEWRTVFSWYMGKMCVLFYFEWNFVFLNYTSWVHYLEKKEMKATQNILVLRSNTDNLDIKISKFY